VVNFYLFFSSSIYFLLNQRDIEKLPIQRLFLNLNKIRRYDDIRCIAKLTTLKFLTLEGERLISDVYIVFFYLGNPLPFPSSYEQIILSQTQPSPVKEDSRQPMNIVNH